MNLLGKLIAPLPDDEKYIEELINKIEKKKDLLHTTSELIKFSSKKQKLVSNSINHIVSLISDEEDQKIITNALEILNNLTQKKKDDVWKLNIEKLTKNESFLQELVSILKTSNYEIRYFAIKLLTNLLHFQRIRIQPIILSTGNGISNIIQLLTDKREAIRNESLLLVTEFIKDNLEIQKIVAFEEIFPILISIIQQEEKADDAVVIQDCFNAMTTLLSDNISNQNYFRETACVQKLVSLLNLTNEDYSSNIEIGARKVTIINTLKIIGILVSGSQVGPNLKANQDILGKKDNLMSIIYLAVVLQIALEIRVMAFHVLGDIIANHPENQKTFSEIKITEESTESQTAKTIIWHILIIILYSPDIEEKIAAVYAFQCYLSENANAQISISSSITITPDELDKESDLDSASIGKLLIDSLIHHSILDSSNKENINIIENNKENANDGDNNLDPLSSWFASVIFCQILKDNHDSKVIALKAPLSTRNDSIQYLLPKLVDSLIQESNKETPKKLIQIGIIKILCIWLFNCNEAIAKFLSLDLVNPSKKTDPQLMTVKEGEMLTFFVSMILSNSNIHIQALFSLLLGICLLFDFNNQNNYSVISEQEKSLLQSQFVRIDNIIRTRIGVDVFIQKINMLKKSPQFIEAELDKSTLEIDVGNVDKFPFYDNEFTIFYKTCLNQIKSQFQNSKKSKKDFQFHLAPSKNNHQLINEQISPNDQIQENIPSKIIDLESTEEFQKIKKEIEEKNSQIQNLKQNLIEKDIQIQNLTQQSQKETEFLQEKLKEQEKEFELAKNEISIAMNFKKKEKEEIEEEFLKVKNELEQFKKDHNELLILYSEMDQENQDLKAENNNLKEQTSSLEARVKSLQVQLSTFNEFNLKKF